MGIIFNIRTHKLWIRLGGSSCVWSRREEENSVVFTGPTGITSPPVHWFLIVKVIEAKTQSQVRPIVSKSRNTTFPDMSLNRLLSNLIPQPTGYLQCYSSGIPLILFIPGSDSGMGNQICPTKSLACVCAWLQWTQNLVSCKPFGDSQWYTMLWKTGGKWHYRHSAILALGRLQQLFSKLLCLCSWRGPLAWNNAQSWLHPSRVSLPVLHPDQKRKTKALDDV